MDLKGMGSIGEIEENGGVSRIRRSTNWCASVTLIHGERAKSHRARQGSDVTREVRTPKRIVAQMRDSCLGASFLNTRLHLGT